MVAAMPLIQMLAPLLCAVGAFLLCGAISCCVYHSKACRKRRRRYEVGATSVINPLYLRREALAFRSNPLVHARARTMSLRRGGSVVMVARVRC